MLVRELFFGRVLLMPDIGGNYDEIFAFFGVPTLNFGGANVLGSICFGKAQNLRKMSLRFLQPASRVL